MKIDTYEISARFFPAYLTLVPIVLLVAVLAPEGRELSLGGAVALVGHLVGKSTGT